MRDFLTWICTGITVILASAPGGAAAEDSAGTIVLRSHTGLADQMYLSQMLGPMDHAIATGITLCGQKLPARTTAKGELEIDTKNNGTFRRIGSGLLSVSVMDTLNKKPLPFKLYISKAPNGDWLYRNVTQLSFAIGEDIVCVIDVDGDGTYNQPGVDGMCWEGESYLFPLPAPNERWCTPHATLTGLHFGAQGQHAQVVRQDLTTVVPDTLALLENINRERIHLGLAPRAENADLSAPLQSHCQYMVGTSVLSHGETPGTPGYTVAGNEAGMNSILGQGTPVQFVASVMMSTFYHRIDVMRPATRGFGLGHAGSFSGIDGRRDLDQGMSVTWPILCPAPDELQVPLAFARESPDPINGVTSAGYPITAYFASGNPVLTAASLSDVLDAGPMLVPCYQFDSNQGGAVDFNRFQQVVGLIPKEPLAEGHLYEVTMSVQAAGSSWKKIWRFSTKGGRETAAHVPH